MGLIIQFDFTSNTNARENGGQWNGQDHPSLSAEISLAFISGIMGLVFQVTAIKGGKILKYKLQEELDSSFG